MVRKTKKPVPSSTDCISCGSACCRYVLIDIPSEPRSERSFEELLWFLFNPHTKLLKEGRQWSLMVLGRCRRLADDGKCRIYPDRPFVCREYPQKTKDECHGPDLRDFSGRIFHSAEELLAYLANERGKEWAKRRLAKMASLR